MFFTNNDHVQPLPAKQLHALLEEWEADMFAPECGQSDDSHSLESMTAPTAITDHTEDRHVY